MDITVFIALGILIESLISIGADIVENKKINPKKLASILLGILLAYAFNLDILSALGMVSRIPYIGIIATGMIARRGSNFISDFWKKVFGSKVDENETGENTNV